MSDTSMDKSWLGHPKGLPTLFFTEMWERLSYYGMRALLILYMTELITSENAGLGFNQRTAATIYGTYTMLVYGLSVPGGIVADRWLGQYRAVFLGGVLIALGNFSLAISSSHLFFFAGLGLIVMGTGLLKPNISTMVGSLYAPGDARRDGGFSIFYMGINIGAALAPLLCGTLGQRVNWRWGFAAAGVGMIFGLTQYWFGRRRLKIALDRIEDRKTEDATKGAEATAEAASPDERPGLFGFTPTEWKRIGVIGVLFVFATFFWAAFEQAGTSLNQFAARYTNTNVLGFEFPSTWFQSFNAVYIVIFAPIFAWLWVWLNKRNREPAAPMKFVIGLVLVGLGFLVLVPPARNIAADPTIQVGVGWLTFTYLLHTLGELSLSPVALSMVTKLAPQKIVGSMMGVWFLSIALGNFVGGQVAVFFPEGGDASALPVIFQYVFYGTVGAGVVLLLFTRPLTRMMGGIR